MRLISTCLRFTPIALFVACVDPSIDTSSAALAADEIDMLVPYAMTPSLHEYEDSPRHPNADDPAIWWPRNHHHAPLVIGVLKDGGIQVYDLTGTVVQSLAVTHRPPLTAADPPSPGPQPDPGTSACPGSSETFGRYNN